MSQPVQKSKRTVSVMGVHIAPDGSIEEFVVPRNKLDLHSFNPDSMLSDVCEFVEGEGPISLLAQLEFQQSNINVFAWEKGDEAVTNKYDYFPPPIDSDVLFGSIFVFRTNRRQGQVQSLTADLFERYIEVCHRGFEDLGSDDSDEEDEDDEEVPTKEDVEFIDNRTLDELEDDASVSEDGSDEDSDGSSADEEGSDDDSEKEEAEFE